MPARPRIERPQVGRVVPLTREHPLELVEFDELGALTKYRIHPGATANACTLPVWPVKRVTGYAGGRVPNPHLSVTADRGLAHDPSGATTDASAPSPSGEDRAAVGPRR